MSGQRLPDRQVTSDATSPCSIDDGGLYLFVLPRKRLGPGGRR